MTSASKILNRMIELKGLSSDVMKNSSDQENYNREFQDLQMQMFDLASLTFNGVSLFATKDDSGNNLTFDNLNQLPGQRYTEVVNVSADGTSGPQVSINKALFLAALTIDASDVGTGQSFDSAGANQNVDSNIALAASDNTEADALDLWDISVGVFQQAIENIATLRADNGGTMSRLRYQL